MSVGKNGSKISAAEKRASLGTKPFCIPQDAENYLKFKSRMKNEEECSAWMLEGNAL